MPLTMPAMILRVRAQIGDQSIPFSTSMLCDGATAWFDLPKQQIQYITVALVNGSAYTPFIDVSAFTTWSSTVAYTTGQFVFYQGNYYQALQNGTNQTPAPSGTAYWSNITSTAFIQDTTLGQIKLGSPPPLNSNLLVNGQSWSLFSDAELQQFCTDAAHQHCLNRRIEERTLDALGRSMYRQTPLSLANLPSIEESLVVDLATINTMWCLANDMATQFNIQTAEGTNIDRSSQYRQVTQQIQLLTQKYQDYCGQLNIGMFRTEVLELRRASYTTGRLVPIWSPQEYDDHKWPTRILPPVNRPSEDNSGLPSPLWNGNWAGGV